MFDIGWSELLVIGVVALIAIGPKELPGVLRMVGQWTGKVRRMAAEFQGQFHEAMREAEMADLKKQVDDLGQTARDLTSFDPLTYDPAKTSADGQSASTSATPATTAPLSLDAPHPDAQATAASSSEPTSSEPPSSSPPALEQGSRSG